MNLSNYTDTGNTKKPNSFEFFTFRNANDFGRKLNFVQRHIGLSTRNLYNDHEESDIQV